MDDKTKTFKNALPMIDTKYQIPPKKELPKSKSW